MDAEPRALTIALFAGAAMLMAYLFGAGKNPMYGVAALLFTLGSGTFLWQGAQD